MEAEDDEEDDSAEDPNQADVDMDEGAARLPNGHH